MIIRSEVGRLYRPASVGEAATTLADLAAKKQTVSVIGGETALDLGNPPARIDAIVSTSALDRVVEYAPADQIVTVEAGITLEQLQARLRPNRQRLAVDPPLAHRATIGGIVATDAYGPRRSRYGTIRDLVVGMTIVRPDGTLARGGGKVVKNVAGFDVPKLMVGSLGTLAMIATVTLRLHPLPERERVLALRDCSASQIRRLANEIVAAQLEPSLVLAVGEGERYTVCVGFEGFAAGVDAQIVSLQAVAEGLGVQTEELAAAERSAFDEAHERTRTEGALRIKISALPGRFPEIDARVIGPLLALLEAGRCVAYPTVGVAFIAGKAFDPRIIPALFEARRVVESGGGTLVITAAPDEIRERIDVWGTPPPAFRLMRALKERFDPEHRFNPGRFVGGL
jgi:glycolate oxidase FAD binding subunit